jgi:hypothetical protein
VARRPRKKTTAAPRRSPAARSRAATTSAAPSASAPAAGSIDLAGGLRQLLDAIETEVRAVSGLSERIDDLVNELNDRRDEQAKRLIVLDALRGSVDDAGLGSFLDKAIRPRRTRVAEVVPDRVAEGV